MKIALITDTHFGARKANVAFHDYFKKFYDDIFFPTIKERNIKNVIHLGDSFDNRKNVDFWALDWAKEVVYDRLEQYNTNLYAIVGNHDVYFKNTNEINAMDSLLTSYKNIKHYSSATEVDIDGFKTLLMPWICQDNYKESMNTIKNSKSKVAFGHLELNGFSLFPGIVQTNAFMGLNPSYFQHFDVVFSGHYHTRSNDGKIFYLGNPYQMYWNDVDDPRGFHIFDTETFKLEFIQNPHTMFEKIYYDDTDVKSFDAENLKDKILKIIETEDQIELPKNNTIKDETLSALEVLGYPRRQVEKLVDKTEKIQSLAKRRKGSTIMMIENITTIRPRPGTLK